MVNMLCGYRTKDNSLPSGVKRKASGATRMGTSCAPAPQFRVRIVCEQPAFFSGDNDIPSMVPNAIHKLCLMKASEARIMRKPSLQGAYLRLTNLKSLLSGEPFVLSVWSLSDSKKDDATAL